MTPRLSFRPGARREIEAARRWYESHLPGLGRAFLAELEATLSFIRAEPAMYAAVGADPAIRRALLHRFPYRIVYQVQAGRDIVILTCLHVRQESSGRHPKSGDG